MALQITTENFEEMVLNSDKPVLVTFGLNGVVLVEWLGQLLMNYT